MGGRFRNWAGVERRSAETGSAVGACERQRDEVLKVMASDACWYFFRE